MAGKNSKKKGVIENPNSRTVCQNRKARHEYDVLDQIDCGIQLYGSEVKSIRNNKVSIDQAYGRIEGNEVWLVNCDIAEYPQATIVNHDRRRKRKLLLHRREIRKFAESGEQQGLTLIPLAILIQRGFVKVRLGLCRGRKLHDKRDRLKKQADRLEMDSAIRKQR
ncbi:MAG: SsrA-binding protein SmpB [Fuerstiella sp.]|nr:SsrA-binding protein SmpB [Fuerstiella sp.]